MTDPYTITPAKREELDVLLGWAAEEGWNPGLHDAGCFYAADPGGFLLGRLDGEAVAGISVVKYGSAFAFLGLYIVRPGFRGRGLGLRLWQAGMATVAGRNVGLDGVVVQQQNYRKSGYSLAWRNIRQEGAGGDSVPIDARAVPLAGVPLTAVLAYDQAFFPDGRVDFLRCWIQQPGGTALGWVEDGTLQGYGVLRPCRSGFKVGPLFADSTAVADGLFNALKSAAGRDAKIYLDTPQANPEAMALARRHGMAPVFETARMYTGPAPALPLQKLYGITTFELG
ncbi:GNAT family N-acetyltransferase [Polaromonas sp. JS666]|uniref:GNAT family N-acetyltransferase n=1 Tax=Polaromonas sp. (strain JS666 / ATCC BAA-500) TaxID=296591 RepID=UPI00088E0FF1|nr:GNAT family N-acetyltransferase [Polaromonas sp. JS666]SDN56825.1 hypothetical protein SAMN05720382_105472 [Polaromonas sp. JS666]